MPEPTLPTRRLPVGAEVLPANEGVHFRVWAPARRRVEVVFEPAERLDPIELARESDGYFSGTSRGARAGVLYRYRLDGERSQVYPDPASRFQPEGPHGPSRVVDPRAFRWTDAAWKGCARDAQVLYEMHVGTFTPEGTYEAAARELPELASLGVTVIEMMPVAEFAGRFGWGYDGVDLFAPTRLYGEPDDLRRFVDRAHALGLGVILDVVYNHLGPDGNYLKQFAREYFTDRYKNDWGEAINFDGERSHGAREFFVANAGYWVDEYHFDGLRIDATQCIYDRARGASHVLAEITRRVRERANGRATLVVAENEPQRAELVRPSERGGLGMDALWNDDFHHTARVALTGGTEAYYTDYAGTPQELLSALKHGYLYQGQRYRWQKQRRGRPALDVHPAAFVLFLQNHDQVANSLRGARIHELTSPARLRAMTTLALLAPGTPMLFQGQEFAASAPFLYFADHTPELAKLVRKGRREFLEQFPSIAAQRAGETLADPSDARTFERCRLDFADRARNAHTYALHRDLLRLRREDPVFAHPRHRGIDGAVLGDDALCVRYFGARDDGSDDRLLLVNLGRDRDLEPAPEPLLCPPEGHAWKLLFSSEDPRYGGLNAPAACTDDGRFRIAGASAQVFAPVPAPAAPDEGETAHERDR